RREAAGAGGGAKRGGSAGRGRMVLLAGMFVALTTALVFAATTRGFADLGNLVNLSSQSSPQPVSGMAVPESSAIAAPAIEVDVPKVVGKGREEAEKNLGEAGFDVAVEEKETSEAEAGNVVSQSPKGSSKADFGSKVKITVAKAPATGVVPVLSGMTPEEAGKALSENGLELGNQDQAPSSSVPEGLISDQDVRATAEVSRGTAVSVTVSSGPAPEPAPAEPAPVEPAPVDPAPSEPVPVEPAPVDPAPSEPVPVEPAPVDPAPVEPAPVEPAPVEPAPADTPGLSDSSGSGAGDQPSGGAAPLEPAPVPPASQPPEGGSGSAGSADPIDPPMLDMPVLND
ncbi:MAG: PASTA domain-containing protein, partial [Rubrobacteraceae bacterium]